MAKIYLHIGIEKTGSTAVQKYLNMYQNQIFKDKAYPKGLFQCDNHMELSSIVLPRKYLKHMNVPEDVEAFQKQLLHFVSSNKDKDIYFSSEHLSSRMTKQEEIQVLLNLLLSSGHKLILIAFYREPEQWIKSHYTQYIASGGNLSFNQYIDESLCDTFIARTTNYANSLKNWKYCVEKISGEVVFKDYGSCKANLIKEFCEIADLEYMVQADSLRSNESYSESQIRIIKLYNKTIGSKKYLWRFKRLVRKLNFQNLKIDWTSTNYSKYVKIQNEILLKCNS